MLHQGVVIVARTKTQRCQRDAFVALTFDQVLQRFHIHRADIHVAVGSDNDAVDAAFDAVLLGQCIGQFNAGAAVGAATCLQAVDRCQDSGFLVARGAFQHNTCRAGVHCQGDAIFRRHLVDQQAQGFFNQAKLVGRLHTA